MSGEELNYHIIGVVLEQQFSFKAGLNNFGKPGEKYSMKELTHIHDMITFTTLDPKNLTREDRSKEMSLILLLV